jgi:Meiotically up-regulated gene 113
MAQAVTRRGRGKRAGAVGREGDASDCYIYAISSEGGPRKIGISAHPEIRAKQLQTAYPQRVTVQRTWHHTNARAVEAEVHRLLAPWRIRGEWFDVSQIRATAAIQRAISHVDSGSESQLTRSTLASMRDVFMPNAARVPGADNDQHRFGYARHCPNLDIAYQIAWLEASDVNALDVYIETDPGNNIILRSALRELRPGDRFLVASHEILGGSDQVRRLLETAQERYAIVQLVDEVIDYSIKGKGSVRASGDADFDAMAGQQV